MARHDDDSVAGTVKSILADTRELIRDELDLMRAEVREEIRSVRTAALAFAGAASAVLLALVLLSIAFGGGLAYWFGWPSWAGYGLVGVMLLTGALGAVLFGRKRLSQVRALPATRETLKENLAWIQHKSAQE
jgi:fructose-specific phosphotransferase system IIC component